MRITIFTLLAAVFMLQGFTHKPFAELSPVGQQKPMYNVDGHYWTVYLVATQLKIPNAKELAFFAEFPDDILDDNGNFLAYTATYLLSSYQDSVHALSGGNPEEERKFSADWVKSAKTPAEKGTALHRLGDSFAHTRKNDKKMFPKGVGHAFAGHRPDKIRKFPTKYLLYVHTLIDALGGKVEGFDMVPFQYVVDQKYDTPTNKDIYKAEIAIQNKQAELTVHSKQLHRVIDYLAFREKTSKIKYVITVKSKSKFEGVIGITYP